MTWLMCLSKFFRDELRTAEAEIDRVKDVYVTLCEEKERLEGKLTEEWKGKMDSELKIVSLPGCETFSYSIQLILKFILLIDIKMPTIVDILTLISRVNCWL